MRNANDTEDRSIAERLTTVERRIRDATLAANRPVDSVTLLAVSKTAPISALRAAIKAGQTRFGESYLTEAIPKIDALVENSLEWHFIGPIQSNKTRGIAERFSWLHSLDRVKIAERLSSQRPLDMPPLQVCIQVNISQETSKSGISLAELPTLIEATRGLPGLCLRGLMAIPAPSRHITEQRSAYRCLRETRDRLVDTGSGRSLDTLSMGMSEDLEAAIMEGSTLIRVGSAIFGPRD